MSNFFSKYYARLRSQNDSIAIGDATTGTTLVVNPGGSINVDATITPGIPGTTINVYSEVTGVAINASQTIFSYTVPAGKTLSLTRVDISSDSVALFALNFNSVTNAKRRIYFTDFNTLFDFSNSQNGLNLTSGTIISLVGTNNSLNSVATFNANLQGTLN